MILLLCQRFVSVRTVCLGQYIVKLFCCFFLMFEIPHLFVNVHNSNRFFQYLE